MSDQEIEIETEEEVAPAPQAAKAPFMSFIGESESMEFFVEGLKKAQSAARELAKAQMHPIWMDISVLLEELQKNGIEFAHSKPLSRTSTLNFLDERESVTTKKLDTNRPMEEKKHKFMMN